MWKLAAVLLLWLVTAPAFAQPIGPTNPIVCNRIASGTIATATTTSLVAGIAGSSIHVCGWHATSSLATASTFQLLYGTQGGPCTSPTVFTPAFSLLNSAPSSDHNSNAFTSLPAGVQLCVATTGASVGIAIMVFYAQF